MFVILLAGCFVFFPFARFVRKQKDTQGCGKGAFFALMTSFAAGMLLSISLVHIMPEASAIYREYKELGHADHDDHDDHRRLEEDEHEEEGFPLPNVIFFLGFMIMLLLDQVIFKNPKLHRRDQSIDTAQAMDGGLEGGEKIQPLESVHNLKVIEMKEIQKGNDEDT